MATVTESAPLKHDLIAHLAGVDLAKLVRLAQRLLEKIVVFNTKVPAVVEAHGKVKVAYAVVEVLFDLAIGFDRKRGTVGEPELCGQLARLTHCIVRLKCASIVRAVE